MKHSSRRGARYTYRRNNCCYSHKHITDVHRTLRCESNSFKRLRTEWFYSPYRSDEIEAYDLSLEKKVNERDTCCIVYIRHFFVTGLDFAYCVHGSANLAKFHSDVHGATAVCWTS